MKFSTLYTGMAFVQCSGMIIVDGLTHEHNYTGYLVAIVWAILAIVFAIRELKE